MKRLLISFAAGVIFAFGLGMSQMTDPNKVLSFLDFSGDWDPSLALVMGAALGLNVFLFRGILKRPAPRFDTKFHLPTFSSIDMRLVLGSALFGLGWGLAGFCPGAAIAAIPTGASSVLLFIGSMGAGMILYRAVDRLFVTAESREHTMEPAAAE